MLFRIRRVAEGQHVAALRYDVAVSDSELSAPPSPLVRAVEDFFVARAPRKESVHTGAAYRRDLSAVLGLLADGVDRPVHQLTPDALTTRALRRAFADYAGSRAAASVARAWSTWNQFCGFLVAEGLLAGNPMSAVDRPRLPPKTPKPLRGERTPEQLLDAVASGIRRARDPWPERDLALIAVALLTGLRSAELLSLTLGSVSGRRGDRRIAVTGKGGADRVLPIEEPLYLLLRAYLDSRRTRFPGRRAGRTSPLFVNTAGEPLRRGGLQYLVRQSFRHAGLHDRVHRGTLVHAFRHTFATRLAEDGATAHEIMRLLGHSSIVSSQTYVDATAREQRAAAASNRTYRALRGLLPLPVDEG